MKSCAQARCSWTNSRPTSDRRIPARVRDKLFLTNNSTATALFSNHGGGVNLDQVGSGGSTLTTNGGFSNYNSYVGLGGSFLNTGTLNVNSSGEFVTSQGLNNSGGIINIANGAILDARVGGASGSSTDTFSNLDGTTGTLGGGGTFNVGGSFLFDPSGGTTGGNIYAIGAGTTLALTSANAQVLYGPGSGTDAIANLTEVAGTLTLENYATHTFTPNGGTFTIDNGGAMNVSGQYATATVSGAFANNGTLNLNGEYGTSNGSTYAALNISGALVNNNAFNISGYSNVLNVGGDLTNAGTFTQYDATSNNYNSTVNVSGNLNNSLGGTYTVGYNSQTNVNLAVNNSGVINVGAADSWNGGTTNASLTAGAAIVNEASGMLNVYSGSTVTAPGFTNNGTLAVLAGGNANFQGGAFTNLSGGTLTGGTYNVGCAFQFDSGSGVINNIATGTSLTLDAQNGGAYQVLSGSTNALANLAGNAGSLTLTNGVSLNTDTTANGGPGTFTNTGTLTTSNTTGSGSNALNVTGNLFNTSPGVVNLNGTGDTMTATGQFVNTGGVNLNGNHASVSSVGFDNQAGGTVTLAANGNSVTSTGAGSNEGTIAFSGTNGAVSSTGDFTNALSGMVTMAGTGDSLFTQGNLNNAGTVTIGSGESVTAGLDYTQTAGTTAVDVNGTLTGGGTIDGNGTINGSLTVDGGTLNPGDPQSIDVTGNYTQTAAGIMDLDLASPSSYDTLTVGGDVSLNGTLDLTLEPGFDATLGTVFDIVTWAGAQTGDFSTFNDPIFDGTLTFKEAFNGNQLDLEVVEATPEPSTLAMLFCAMLMGAGIAWRVRRRSKNVLK